MSIACIIIGGEVIGEMGVIMLNHIYDSRILLVDDSAELLELVEGILKREGFLYVERAADCAGARAILDAEPPDLIVLDINLPDGDGFGLMQELRTVSMVPVLFLSARDQDNDRLLGLGLGADDYMTKPFLPRELVLRITAILKRTYFPLSVPQKAAKLILGGRTVDFDSASVEWAEGGAVLTAKELALLKKLSENRGNIVTFDALCQAVWQDQYYGYENTLMVHIRRLREKIEEEPSHPQWLLTVRGLGYRLAR